PGAASATGRYDLHSWTGDVQVRYDYVLRSGWAVRPHAGVTYLRTTRTAVTETSASPFALTVARDRHVAGFADAGMAFGRSEASVAAFRPWVSFGLRYQVEGLQTDTLAGYAGGALALDARGAPRTRAVGTAEGGIAYRLPSGLDLFASAGSQTGTDDHQESLTAGARLRF
ncbi:MAG: autotransporter outer membrane beta-barrel domain-containing protein, partial [Sphingomonas sp.]